MHRMMLLTFGANPDVKTVIPVSYILWHPHFGEGGWADISRQANHPK
jgi:hypothetical protein